MQYIVDLRKFGVIAFIIKMDGFSSVSECFSSASLFPNSKWILIYSCTQKLQNHLATQDIVAMQKCVS